jgi:hypothetical protein
LDRRYNYGTAAQPKRLTIFGDLEVTLNMPDEYIVYNAHGRPWQTEINKLEVS